HWPPTSSWTDARPSSTSTTRCSPPSSWSSTPRPSSARRPAGSPPNRAAAWRSAAARPWAARYSGRWPAPSDRRSPLPSPHLVVMGVSGAGKPTVARAISERAGSPFLDADDLHPPTNRRKLGAGEPLGGDDRAPWLAAVRDRMRDRDHPADFGSG